MMIMIMINDSDDDDDDDDNDDDDDDECEVLYVRIMNTYTIDYTISSLLQFTTL